MLANLICQTLFDRLLMILMSSFGDKAWRDHATEETGSLFLIIKGRIYTYFNFPEAKRCQTISAVTHAGIQAHLRNERHSSLCIADFINLLKSQPSQAPIGTMRHYHLPTLRPWDSVFVASERLKFYVFCFFFPPLAEIAIDRAWPTRQRNNGKIFPCQNVVPPVLSSTPLNMLGKHAATFMSIVVVNAFEIVDITAWPSDAAFCFSDGFFSASC